MIADTGIGEYSAPLPHLILPRIQPPFPIIVCFSPASFPSCTAFMPTVLMFGSSAQRPRPHGPEVKEVTEQRATRRFNVGMC
jgi:hypothetical protein